ASPSTPASASPSAELRRGLEAHAEDRAGVGIFDPDRAALGLDGELAECEAEAAVGARAAIALDEALEHLLAQRGRYAGAGVDDAKLDGRALRDPGEPDRAAGGRVADRVVEQVLENAAHQVGIAADRVRRDLDGDLDLGRPRPRRHRAGD